MRIVRIIEQWTAYALFGLMAIVVVAATLELGHEIIVDIIKPPGLFIGLSELFDLFGLFLMVLIGLELLVGMTLFIKERVFHVESMFLVALTAVTRKIVILDSKAIDPLVLFGLGFLLVSLVTGYYVIRKSRGDA